MGQDPDSGRSSFWQTLPGILSGLAALITAIAGAWAIWWREPTPRPPRVPPQEESIISPSGTSAGSNSGTTSSESLVQPKIDCVAEIIKQWPDAKQEIAEVGLPEKRYEHGQNSIALRLMDGESPVGYMVIGPFRSDVTQVLAVRDKDCNPGENISEPSRSFPVFVKDYGTLKIKIGQHAYEIELGREGHQIEVNYLVKLD